MMSKPSGEGAIFVQKMLFRSAVGLLALSGISQASLRTRAAHDHRELSFERIGGYEPTTLVTDHNAVDLDVEKINSVLGFRKFDEAYAVYRNGAFSKAVATLTLTEPLDSALSADTPVTGSTSENKEVEGVMYDDYPIGASEIRVQYQAGSIQSDYQSCNVGGNPDPNVAGCFTEVGEILVAGKTLSYEYTALADNQNERSIQKFSTGAYKKMYTCPSCPYVDYEKFYDYYGVDNYADEFVNAAYGGTRTDFRQGDQNFGGDGESGRAEAFRNSIVQLNVWMYVIREMEDAIDDCNNGCTVETCNDDIVHAWDEAVAFYTGSLEGQSGTGKGVMSFALAEYRCKEFGTCANGDDGISKVNEEIMQQFKLGQSLLLQNKCEDLRPVKERIVQLMIIPNIQSTIKYAYYLSQVDEVKTPAYADSRQRQAAGGAIAAASILPYIHSCNEDDAQTIYSNLQYNVDAQASFTAVKNAIERNLACIGITCDDVGGLLDKAEGGYLNGAGPCSSGKKKDRSKSKSSSTDDENANNSLNLIIVIAIGGVAFILIIAFAICKFMRRKRTLAETEMTKEGELS